MKRIIGSILALTLLLGCIPAALAQEAEPVHVIMLDPYYGDASSEKGYQMVHDYILEQTGVDVTSYRFTSSDKSEKTNRMLGATDMKVNTWCSNWTTYVGFDMIQPINDYMDLIPSVQEKWTPYNAMSTVMDPNGNVWGVPRISSRAFYQSFLRQDWLDQLNLAYPTTFEDFEKCLYAIKDADPYGNGETIPLIIRNNMTTMEYHFLAGFTKYGRSNWLDNDGLLKPYYLQEGYYDFLEKMNQWYADGIIHAENITWNTATIRNYLASGRVAGSAAYTTDVSAQYINTKVNYPTAVWYYPQDGLVGPNGNMCETLIAANDECTLFNKKNTDEEMRACLKVIEWGYSDWTNNKVLTSGIQGVHWEYDTSYENCYTDHITKTLDVDPSIVYRGDFWYTIGIANEGDCIQYDPDGQQNFHNYMLRHQKDFYTCTLPFDLGVIYNNSELYENVISANDIETMVSREIFDFFKGEKQLTRENWQAFINDLYDNGLQEYIEEYTRQYKAWNNL